MSIPAPSAIHFPLSSPAGVSTASLARSANPFDTPPRLDSRPPSPSLDRQIFSALKGIHLERGTTFEEAAKADGKDVLGESTDRLGSWRRSDSKDPTWKRRKTQIMTPSLWHLGSGEGWKMSRERAQLVLTFAMIALVGMNDSATGANLSSMQLHYDVSYEQISLVFLSNVAGYSVSCVSSSFITQQLGLRWALVVAGGFMTSGCLILAVAPPYPIFVSSLALLGFGSGLYDAALTTVVSHEEDSVLMSTMYACFGVGAMFSPLIIGAFVDHGIAWNYYYWLPFSIAIILGVVAFPVFSTYEAPPDEVHTADIALTTIPVEASEVVTGRAIMSVRTRMARALGMRAVWTGFVLIIVAFGSLDTLSAWMVTYMVEKRGAPSAASRYQLSGLWGGIALGRVVLAYVGRRMGERTFALMLLSSAIGFLGVVWGVQNSTVDACAIVLVGFFIGPVTPKVLSSVAARVPTSLKPSVMSLTIGLGLIGSSVGPLAFGVVAGGGGLASLPAVLIVANVISMVGWAIFPSKIRRED